MDQRLLDILERNEVELANFLYLKDVDVKEIESACKWLEKVMVNYVIENLKILKEESELNQLTK